MKTKVIIIPIAVAIMLTGCSNSDNQNKPLENNKTVVAPLSQPAADFSYSYVENAAELPEPKLIFETRVCNLPVETDESLPVNEYPETIVAKAVDKDVLIYDDYKGSGSAQVDFYDYIVAQNTTIQTINPIFGGSIKGKQETIINIPEEAFETLDSMEVEGPVNVSISEYFSKSDFIMAGLSSSCGDKMIESSGMFNVKATSADGKEVRLKKNKKIQIALPENKKALKGTAIFYGDKNHETTTATAPQNWVFPNVQGAPRNTADSKAWLKLESKILFNISFNDVKLNDSVRAPRRNLALHVMNPNYKVKSEKSFVRYLAIRHSTDKYFQKFFVKKGLYSVVQSMGELDSLKLTFTIDSKGRLRKTVAKSKTMSAEGMASIENAFNIGKKRFNMNVLHKNYGDYVMYLVKRTPPSFYIGSDGIFDVGQLGWINCDRFLDSKQPLIAMEIDEKETPETRYFCVFNSLNSIMPAYVSNSGNYMFPNIPQNLDATIVGIRNSKTDKPEVSITSTKSAPEFKSQAFTAVTPAEMKLKLSIAFGETPAAVSITKP